MFEVGDLMNFLSDNTIDFFLGFPPIFNDSVHDFFKNLTSRFSKDSSTNHTDSFRDSARRFSKDFNEFFQRLMHVISMDFLQDFSSGFFEKFKR